MEYVESSRPRAAACSTSLSNVVDDVFEQLVAVMTKYDCDSVADAVEIASTIALERDEAELA